MHMHPERNMSSHLLLFLPPASCFRIKRAEGRCSLGHQHSFLHEQKSSGLGDREILARPCRCLPFLFPLWLPILDTTVQPLSLTQHLKFSARVARRGAFFFSCIEYYGNLTPAAGAVRPGVGKRAWVLGAQGQVKRALLAAFDAC